MGSISLSISIGILVDKSHKCMRVTCACMHTHIYNNIFIDIVYIFICLCLYYTGPNHTHKSKANTIIDISHKFCIYMCTHKEKKLNCKTCTHSAHSAKCTRVCIHTLMYVYTIHAHIYVYIYVHTHIYVYIHNNTNICITHTHILVR